MRLVRNRLVRKFRTLFGLKRREVAYLLGISSSSVDKWESGERVPSIEHLGMLARLVNDKVEFKLPFDEKFNVVTNAVKERMVRERWLQMKVLVNANGKKRYPKIEKYGV